ncbi:DUF397 domain-containing protein [Nocardia sp. NPDC058499]|uniref:DUF397 domain-containing protein n=1 Tax=Nocardia sp. NPDC058499 TaxID=3346530 RepID=UPI003666401B
MSRAERFKSSRRAGGNHGVEAAHLNGGQVGVLDSENPAGPASVFAPGEWDAFLTCAEDGDFDRP